MPGSRCGRPPPTWDSPESSGLVLECLPLLRQMGGLSLGGPRRAFASTGADWNREPRGVSATTTNCGVALCLLIRSQLPQWPPQQ